MRACCGLQALMREAVDRKNKIQIKGDVFTVFVCFRFFILGFYKNCYFYVTFSAKIFESAIISRYYLFIII